MAVGQQWVYQVRNLYNHEVIDEITETVVAIAPVIRIQRTSQRSGVLADEIQSSWGMITQDAHWKYPITFARPLPAWPARLEADRSTTYDDRYRMLASSEYSEVWDLTITPREWTRLQVPAGTFTAFRFDNLIDFQNEDLNVVASQRMESVWFAPAVGRWVLRRTHGIYYVSGRGGEMPEDYLQWELVSWR